MKFNPDMHHRRSIRLKDYDYSRNGAYFLTMCTFDRGCHFERFAQLRHIVEAQWRRIPERFPGVVLDEYVIMPNHVHGIIVLCRDNPYRDPGSGNDSVHLQGVPLRKSDIGSIIGSFKSLCVDVWLKTIKSENLNATGKFWQNNYYEHVIRNDGEMERIRQYIVNNPLRWDLDRENPGYSKEQAAQEERWMV